MQFTPNYEENILLSKIVSNYGGEYTLLRFTPTMLLKSIIDASQPIRTLFKDNNVIDYDNLVPGGEKYFLEGLLITDKIEPLKISCYRPKTKKGDPRFWIYDFKKKIRPNEMIYITIYDGKVCIIPLVDYYFNEEEIKSFFSKCDTKEFFECLTLIKHLSNRNILSVSPYKLNPKDIGDTLERELNILPNSSKLADFKGKIELKAKRKGGKTKDTLFSMVPNWYKSNIQSSSDMILTYGYQSKKYPEFMDLFVTVSNQPNNQGLFLQVDYDNEVVIQKHVENNGSILDVCVWDFKDLKNRLYTKHPETFWVVGEALTKDDKIYFNYQSIEHSRSPIFSSFLLLIEQGYITYDWRGRVKNDGTGYKDKGHCFRLKPSHRNMLFGKLEVIDL